MIVTIKRYIKELINSIGYEINRSDKCPSFNLLGLKNYNISSIIDIGANEGQFAKFIQKHFPLSDIYCFEPIPEAYHRLEKWADKMNSRIHIYNMAIGEENGTIDFYIHESHPTSSSILRATSLHPFGKSQNKITISIVSIDDFIQANKINLKKDILVKMDVQGYERYVIKGGGHLLSEAVACKLEIIIFDYYEGQSNLLDIFNRMYELGYTYAGNFEQGYKPDGKVFYIDVLFLKKIDKQIQYS